MIPWNTRPHEIGNLLNPPFLSALLRTSISAYVDICKARMPLEISPLVLPLCLHESTSSLLPRSAKVTSLHMWIQRDENRSILIGFPERVRALAPFTHEAIIFGGSRGVIAIDRSGALMPGPAKWPNLLSGSNRYANSGEDTKKSIRRARVTGGLLATAGSPEFAYSLFGVRP